MKSNITVHINGNIYEVTKRTYKLSGIGELDTKEEVMSYHGDLDEALVEMNKQIAALEKNYLWYGYDAEGH